MSDTLDQAEAKMIFEKLHSLMGRRVNFDHQGDDMTGKLVKVNLQMEYIKTKIEVMVDYGMSIEIVPGMTIEEVKDDD